MNAPVPPKKPTLIYEKPTTLEPIGATGTPYRDLAPFLVEDAAFFFGRTEDIELIASYIEVYPLTILYGESGVGKSSLLQAGLLAHLESADYQEEPAPIVIYQRTWTQNPDDFLRTKPYEVLQLDSSSLPKKDNHLDTLLYDIADKTGRHIYYICDQFEDYFLLHPSDEVDKAFASIVNSGIWKKNKVHILLSIRQDCISLLDRWETRIAHLFDHRICLKHLREDQAIEAIIEPIRSYNKNNPTETWEVPNEEFVTGILEGIVAVQKEKRNTLNTLSNRDPDAINASFLQMVLIRLWEEEVRRGQKSLSLETLTRLGDVNKVIIGYVQAILETMSWWRRRYAVWILNLLVTPTGQPLLLSEEDIDRYTGKGRLFFPPPLNVLQELVGKRLLFETKDKEYRIFHDAMGGFIAKWTREDLQRAWFRLLCIVMLMILVPIEATLYTKNRAELDKANKTALEAVALTKKAQTASDEDKKRANDLADKLLGVDKDNDDLIGKVATLLSNRFAAEPPPLVTSVEPQNKKEITGLFLNIKSKDKPFSWEAARKNLGCVFGYQKATEGNKYSNPAFPTVWQQMGELHASKFSRGAFHFYSPPGLQPEIQAQNFINTLQRQPNFDDMLPPILLISPTLTLQTSAQELVPRLKVWLQKVETALHKKPFIAMVTDAWDEDIVKQLPEYLYCPIIWSNDTFPQDLPKASIAFAIYADAIVVKNEEPDNRRSLMKFQGSRASWQKNYER